MPLFHKGTILKYHFNAVLQVSAKLKRKTFSCSPKYFATTHLYYCNGQSPARKFVSSENIFAHKILENISTYNLIVFSPQRCAVPEAVQTADDIKNLSLLDIPIQKLCNLVEIVGYLDNNSSDDVNQIFDVVKVRCHEMNDDQLAFVLKSLKHSSFFEYNKRKQLSSLWKAIDKVCLDRWKFWPLNKVFYFMDLWYNLNLLKRSDFAFYGMLKFIRKPGRLSPQQVVQLLFYLNIFRNITKNISLFDLECRLEECIKELSIEEIGVAMMGFFKSEKIIHSEKILNYIIDKTIDEIKTVPEITLACILKALRNSINISMWDRIPQFLNVIEEELPRLTIQCAVHASLLTVKGSVLHDNVLTKVSQKLIDNIATCRLKDMEKAVLPLSKLNFYPKTDSCIYQSIQNELIKEERKAEAMEYPKTFVALVHYLCLKGIYDENFIKKVLDLEFIHATYGTNKYLFGREILYIDTTVELECPSYVGPRLPEKIRNYLSWKYSEYLPNPTKKKKTAHQIWHSEIKEITETIFGKENIVEKYLLPNHPRSDIVVNLNHEKEALPLDMDWKNTKDFTGPIKAPPKSNYYALVVGSKNMFLFNTTIPNGETVSKLKQLRLLGYKPILICCEDWPSKRSTIEKVRHLKTIISSETLDVPCK